MSPVRGSAGKQRGGEAGDNRWSWSLALLGSIEINRVPALTDCLGRFGVGPGSEIQNALPGGVVGSRMLLVKL